MGERKSKTGGVAGTGKAVDAEEEDDAIPPFWSEPSASASSPPADMFDFVRRLNCRLVTGSVARVRIEMSWGSGGLGGLGGTGVLSDSPVGVKVTGVRLILTPWEKAPRKRKRPSGKGGGSTLFGGRNASAPGEGSRHGLSTLDSGTREGSRGRKSSYRRGILGLSVLGGGSGEGGGRYNGCTTLPDAGSQGGYQVFSGGGQHRGHHLHGEQIPSRITSTGLQKSWMVAKSLLPVVIEREVLKSRRNGEMKLLAGKRRRALERMDIRRKKGEIGGRRFLGLFGPVGDTSDYGGSVGVGVMLNSDLLWWKSFRRNLLRRIAENLHLEIEGAHVQIAFKRDAKAGGTPRRRTRAANASDHYHRIENDNVISEWTERHGGGGWLFGSNNHKGNGEGEESNGFTAGIVLESLTVHTTDAIGNRQYSDDDVAGGGEEDSSINSEGEGEEGQYLFKSIKVNSLGVYMEEDIIDIMDLSKKNRKKGVGCNSEENDGTDDESLFGDPMGLSAYTALHHEDFQGTHRSFLINPVSLEGAYRLRDPARMKLSTGANITFRGSEDPTHLIFAQLPHLSVVLCRRQLELANEMVEALILDGGSVGRHESGAEVGGQHSPLRPVFPEYRPGCSITALTARDWWTYAARSVLRLSASNRARQRLQGMDDLGRVQKSGYVADLGTNSGRGRLWVDFMMSFRKRKQYRALYRRHYFNKNKEEFCLGISTKEADWSQWKKVGHTDLDNKGASKSEDNPEPLGNVELCEMRDIESDRSISLEAIVLWRAEVVAVMRQEWRIGAEDREKPPQREALMKKTSIGGLLQSIKFRGSKSVTTPVKDDSNNGSWDEVAHSITKEDVWNLGTELKGRHCGPRLGASVELELSVGFIVIELIGVSLGPVAKVRLGPIEIAVHQVVGDGDASISFSLSSIQVEDMTTMGGNYFPTVMRSVHHSTQNFQDAKCAETQNDTETPAPALNLTLKRWNGGSSRAVALRTAPLELVFSAAFLGCMSEFFFLRPSTSSCDDDITAADRVPAKFVGLGGSVPPLYVFLRNAHRKLMYSFVRSVRSVFSSQCQPRLFCSFDCDVGAPILLFPPDPRDRTSTGSGTVETFAVRLGRWRITNAKGETENVAAKRWLKNEGSSSAVLSPGEEEGRQIYIDRWRLEVQSAMASLGASGERDWVGLMHQSGDWDAAALLDADLCLIVRPFNANIEIGIATSERLGSDKKGKRNTLRRLTWVDCTLPLATVQCKPIHIILISSSMQRWATAWQDTISRHSSFGDTSDLLFLTDSLSSDSNESPLVLEEDDPYSALFLLKEHKPSPIMIEHSFHISGVAGRLSVFVDMSAKGIVNLRLLSLMISNTSGSPEEHSSHGKIRIGGIWLQYQEKEYQPRLLLGSSPKIPSFEKQQFSSAYSQDDALSSLAEIHWRISRSIDDLDPMNSNTPASRISAALQIDMGSLEVYWHTDVMEKLEDTWQVVKRKAFATKLSETLMIREGFGRLDRSKENEDNGSQSSVSTAPSLLESYFTGRQTRLKQMFPIFWIVKAAIALPSPDALVSFKSNVTSLSITTHVDNTKDDQLQFLVFNAKKILLEIDVQGDNMMNAIFVVEKIKMERSLTYTVHQGNMALIESKNMSNKWLTLKYCRQASVTKGDDLDAFRTRATTVMHVLPTRVVYLQPNIDMLTYFLTKANLSESLITSAGSVARLMQFDTVVQEYELNLVAVAIDIPEAGLKTNKVSIQLSDVIGRFTNHPFSGGGVGKVDFKGMSVIFSSGGELFKEPIELAVNTILSPVNDSENHQVLKVETYLPEIQIMLTQSQYKQLNATLCGNLRAKRTCLDKYDDDQASESSTKSNRYEMDPFNTFRPGGNRKKRHVPIKLEFNVKMDLVLLSLWINDGANVEPFVDIHANKADVSLQVIISDRLLHIAGKFESFGVKNGADCNDHILSRMECTKNHQFAKHMLHLRYELYRDNCTEVSADIGDLQAVLSRSVLEKANIFVSVDSKSASVNPNASIPRSVIKLKFSRWQVVILEKSVEECDRLVVQGQCDSEYTLHRDITTGHTDSMELQASGSSVSFYTASGDKMTNLVHILEPTDFSFVASSTFSEKAISSNFRIISLSPICVTISMQDTLFLHASFQLVWALLKVFFVDVTTDDSSRSSDENGHFTEIVNRSFCLLPQSPQVPTKTSDINVAETLHQNPELNEYCVEIPKQGRTRITDIILIPMQVKTHLIVPSVTLVFISDSDNIGKTLLKWVVENIFCDGQLASRSESEEHTFRLYPISLQLWLSSFSKLKTSTSLEWEPLSSPCELGMVLRQEKSSEEGRHILKVKVELQSISLFFSDIALDYIIQWAQFTTLISTTLREQSNLISHQHRDKEIWRACLMNDLYIFMVSVPQVKVTLCDLSDSERKKEEVASLFLEDLKMECVSLYWQGTRKTPADCAIGQAFTQSRFTVTVRRTQLQDCSEAASPVVFDIFPYGSDSLRIIIFTQRAAGSNDVTINEADASIGESESNNPLMIYATDRLVLKLDKMFKTYSHLIYEYSKTSKSNEAEVLYHIKRTRVDPIHIKVAVDPEGNQYLSAWEGSPIQLYLQSLPQSSNASELTLAGLSNQHLTGPLETVLSSLQKAYILRLMNAVEGDRCAAKESSEIPQQDKKDWRQQNIPTFIFIDSLDIGSDFDDDVVLEDFKGLINRIADSVSKNVRNGNSNIMEERRPLHRLGSMLFISTRIVKK